MNSSKRILAYSPVEDEGLKAVKQAAWIARTNGASITVLRVLDSGVGLGLWKPRDDDPGSADLRLLIENALREEIESQVASFRSDGLDIRVDVRWGTPWLEVTYSVLRDGYDLVIKAASGADKRRRPFLGSTALHLIRKCPCPVWIVGNVWDGTRGRILAAVDPADEGTRPAHAQEILKWGLSLAGENGEIHAASAWRASGETLLRGRVRSDELDAFVQSSEEYARSGLANLLASVGNPLDPERVHLLKGHAREVLTNFIERQEIDLAVLGSVGRVGVAGLFIGETAETLVRSVRTSVFVVKPPGFVSPVELPTDYSDGLEREGLS